MSSEKRAQNLPTSDSATHTVPADIGSPTGYVPTCERALQRNMKFIGFSSKEGIVIGRYLFQGGGRQSEEKTEPASLGQRTTLMAVDQDTAVITVRPGPLTNNDSHEPRISCRSKVTRRRRQQAHESKCRCPFRFYARHILIGAICMGLVDARCPRRLASTCHSGTCSHSGFCGKTL